MEYLQVKNTTGEVEVVMYTTEGQPEPEIGVQPTVTILPVPSGSDALDYLHNKYYSFNDQVWRDKPQKPNQFYDYDENFNVLFNVVRFEETLRKIRNGKLAASDWTQMPDSPLNEEQKGAWATYRQQLRDITEHLSGVTDLEQVPWPTEPV